MLNFLRDEEGQGMVEYGLIIGLISVVAIAVLLTLGPKIKDRFQDADNAMTTKAATPGT